MNSSESSANTGPAARTIQWSSTKTSLPSSCAGGMRSSTRSAARAHEPILIRALSPRPARLFGWLRLKLVLEFQHRLPGLHVNNGILRIDAHQGVEDDPRRGQSGEPLVISRYYVPRRVAGARRCEHLLVRLLVVVPVRPLFDVLDGELPVLVRLLNTGDEPPALFFLRQMQEELHHAHPVVDQISLPVVDLAVAPFPDARLDRAGREVLMDQQLRVHPDNENFLVVRSVEDPDHSPLR